MLIFVAAADGLDSPYAVVNGLSVFPDLPGVTWNASKSPEFKTETHRSVSGRELRATFQQFPLYTFNLTYDVLRDGALTELKQLLGFFMARQGSFGAFLYQDKSDCAVTDMAFGAGNGTQTQFQLTRAYGFGNTFAEPVQNPNLIQRITANGVTLVGGVDYTVSSTGLVTFAVAPDVGASLAWTGTFFYRVRFVKDVSEFNQFLLDLWENKKVDFVGAPGNKI